MVKTCSAKCAKFIVFAVNVVFWLSGAVLLGVGIWAKVDKNFQHSWDSLSLSDAVDSKFDVGTAAVLCIVLGAIIFLVGFCGCFGALRESRILLGIYIAFLVLVLLLELAAGIIAIVFRSQLSTGLRTAMKKAIEKKVRYNWTIGTESENMITAFYFELQYNAKCCGVDGYADYFNTSRYQNDTSSMGVLDTAASALAQLGGGGKDKCKMVPATCCEQKNTDGSWKEASVTALCCNAPQLSNVDRNKNGCYSAAEGIFSRNLLLISIIGIGFALFQIVVAIAAICLCVSVGEQSYDYA